MPYDVKFNPQTASIQSQRITDATVNSDGVMTKAFVRLLLSLVPGGGPTLASSYIAGGGSGGSNNKLGDAEGMSPPLGLRAVDNSSVIDITDPGDVVQGSLGLVAGAVAFFAGIGKSILVRAGAAAAASAGNNATLEASDATGPGDLDGGNVVLKPGAAANDGNPGVIDMLWAQLVQASSARVLLAAVLEQAGFSAIDVVAQGTAPSATDPFVRVSKNRTNPNPDDTLIFACTDSLGVLQNVGAANKGPTSGIPVPGMFLFPGRDLLWDIGSAALRFATTWSRLYATVTGAPISSTGANVTIAPTSGIHVVSGAGSIKTITPPFVGFIGTIALIPTGSWTMVTGGNIGKAASAQSGQTMFVTTPDGTTWFPSYS